MRKRIAIVALVMCALFLLAACGSGSSALVGKWKDEATGMMTMEFKDDGTLSVSALGQTQTVSYKVDGDKITMTADGQEATGTFKVEGNKLTLTGPDNDTEIYVKE